jgi:hypothetical protein
VSNKINSTSIKDRIKAAKLPEKTVPICLRGDLQSEFERLEAELEKVQQQGSSGRLNDPRSAEAHRLAERIKQLGEQMRDETETFTLRALPRRRYDALAAEHPPREGVATDAMLGTNAQTWWPAIVQASVISPELDDEDWDNLLGWEPGTKGEDDEGFDGLLTSFQFSQLCDWAFALNRREFSLPFSQIASAVLAISGIDSKPQNG